MRIIQWFKQLFGKKVLIAIHFLKDKNISKGNLYVNKHGILMFKDENFNNPVFGLTEWKQFEKNFFKISQSTTVIDVLIAIH